MNSGVRRISADCDEKVHCGPIDLGELLKLNKVNSPFPEFAF
jgi:hypothetical protein